MPYCKTHYQQQFGPRGYDASATATSRPESTTTSGTTPMAAMVAATGTGTSAPVKELFKTNCPKCGKRVYAAERTPALGRDWHRLCFRAPSSSSSFSCFSSAHKVNHTNQAAGSATFSCTPEGSTSTTATPSARNATTNSLAQRAMGARAHATSLQECTRPSSLSLPTSRSRHRRPTPKRLRHRILCPSLFQQNQHLLQMSLLRRRLRRRRRLSTPEILKPEKEGERERNKQHTCNHQEAMEGRRKSKKQRGFADADLACFLRFPK